MRVAAIQMNATDDRTVNIATAERLVTAAAGASATLIVLPEKWNGIVPDAKAVDHAEALNGPSLTAAGEWAVRHGVTVLAGSILERVEGAPAAFNTSVLIEPDGHQRVSYRKIHLFDVDVNGHQYRESAATHPGDQVVLSEVDGHPVGLSICYDLRFPELYRQLSRLGATILTVPAAFTATTGAAHWEPLIRARAIENQAFVIAAGQVGSHVTGTASYGHSMIVDPWGVVLAEGGGEDEEVVIADLDLTRLVEVRRSLPALEHRRDGQLGNYPEPRH